MYALRPKLPEKGKKKKKKKVMYVSAGALITRNMKNAISGTRAHIP